jgi:hypothetical protein
LVVVGHLWNWLQADYFYWMQIESGSVFLEEHPPTFLDLTIEFQKMAIHSTSNPANQLQADSQLAGQNYRNRHIDFGRNPLRS